jgi:hypothetical protein
VVRTAHFDNKWEPIIGYQWRMQDLFHVVQEHHGLRAAWDVLRVFIDAHMSGYHSTGDEDHLVWFRRLTERSIKICNTLQQFRTQAETMCSLGHVLRVVGEFDDARMMYLEAGRIAEHHGFLSVESAVCLGLGLMHMESGDEEYGVKLLRNAVLAIDFSVEPSTSHVLKSLESLSVSLFKTGDTDGLETVVLRLHHEAEEAMLASPSAYFVFYLRSTVLCAQLCQVPSLPPPPPLCNIESTNCNMCLLLDWKFRDFKNTSQVPTSVNVKRLCRCKATAPSPPQTRFASWISYCRTKNLSRARHMHAHESYGPRLRILLFSTQRVEMWR